MQAHEGELARTADVNGLAYLRDECARCTEESNHACDEARRAAQDAATHAEAAAAAEKRASGLASELAAASKHDATIVLTTVAFICGLMVMVSLGSLLQPRGRKNA